MVFHKLCFSIPKSIEPKTSGDILAFVPTITMTLKKTRDTKSRCHVVTYGGFKWKDYEKAVNQGLGRKAKPGRELVHVWTCWREHLPVQECVEDINNA